MDVGRRFLLDDAWAVSLLLDSVLPPPSAMLVVNTLGRCGIDEFRDPSARTRDVSAFASSVGRCVDWPLMVDSVEVDRAVLLCADCPVLCFELYRNF